MEALLGRSDERISYHYTHQDDSKGAYNEAHTAVPTQIGIMGVRSSNGRDWGFCQAGRKHGVKTMPNVSLGNGRLAWWLILESARRARGNLIPVEERKIILITPWIRRPCRPCYGRRHPFLPLGQGFEEIELLSECWWP